MNRERLADWHPFVDHILSSANAYYQQNQFHAFKISFHSSNNICEVLTTRQTINQVGAGNQNIRASAKLMFSQGSRLETIHC